MIKKYILCVDDDPDDCSLLHEFLTKYDPDIDISYVSDGQAAIDFLEQSKQKSSLPVLVIMDINMPKLSGKDATKIIKKDAVLKILPVVLMSTAIKDPDLVEIEALGAAILRKPDTLSGYDEIAKTLTSSLKLKKPDAESEVSQAWPLQINF